MMVGYAQRVAELAQLRATRARLEAREMVLLAELAAQPDPYDKQWVREEVACALRVSPAVARDRLGMSALIVDRLPGTVAAMADGQVSLRHAEKLAEATIDLDVKQLPAIEAHVLPTAGQRSFRSFSSMLDRAVAKADPAHASKKARRARRDRRIYLLPQGDTTTELRALLSNEHAVKIADRIQALAESWKAADPTDDRTNDQLRADAFVAICFGAVAGVTPTAGPSGSGDADVDVAPKYRPRIVVTVPLTALVGLSDTSCEVNGELVPAAVARAFAAEPTATFRRLITDEGIPMNLGRTVYRPSAGLAEFIRLRDRTCRFPYCDRPAAHCEIDHVVAWEDGGQTNADNLHPLCLRHHHVKHDTGWTVTRHDDNSTEWRSPAGKKHVKPPPDPVAQDPPF